MTTNIEGLTKFIIQSLNETGGATVNLFGFSPADGYMVGGMVEEATFFGGTTPAKWSHRDVGDFITEHEDMLRSNPELFVGAWLNTETGMVHLDISERCETIGVALLLAGERDEIAIWDLKNSKEIRLVR